MSRLYLSIALRYLKAKKGNKFISISGMFSFIAIMLGVAILIIVMSVMSGFEKELVKKIIGMNAHLFITASKYGFDNSKQEIKAIEDIKGIKIAMPIINGQAMIMGSSSGSGAFVKGISPEDFKRRDMLKNSIVLGNIDDMKKDYTVILGYSLAKELGVTIGSTVTFLIPENYKTILGIMPRIKDFTVVALFNVGMSQYDSGLAFINLYSAQRFFKFGDYISRIEIMTYNLDKADEYKQIIQDYLDENDLSNRHVYDWKFVNNSLINALKVERTVMFMILASLLLIAAFNIISSLIMLVEDKNKHIALMRTMGMSRLGVMSIFMIIGAIMGIVGSSLGAILGCLFTININNIKIFLETYFDIALFDPVIYFLSNLPSEISISDTINIIIFSILTSIVAAIYPAWKASNLQPANILKYEI